MIIQPGNAPCLVRCHHIPARAGRSSRFILEHNGEIYALMANSYDNDVCDIERQVRTNSPYTVALQNVPLCLVSEIYAQHACLQPFLEKTFPVESIWYVVPAHLTLMIPNARSYIRIEAGIRTPHNCKIFKNGSRVLQHIAANGVLMVEDERPAPLPEPSSPPHGSSGHHHHPVVRLRPTFESASP